MKFLCFLVGVIIFVIIYLLYEIQYYCYIQAKNQKEFYEEMIKIERRKNNDR